MRRILFPLLVIGLAGGLFTLGSGAFFSDTETDTGNIISAGTVDLVLRDGEGAPGANHCSASGVAPDKDVDFTDSGEDCSTSFLNNGSLTADLYVQFTVDSYGCTDSANGGLDDDSQYCDAGADLLASDFVITAFSGPAGWSIVPNTSTLQTLENLGCTLATADLAADASTAVNFDLKVSSTVANAAQGDAIKITITGQLVQPDQPGTCS
jgi:predicted ribosomally synthesized peptide with SipW-like signal peptide